MQTNALPPEKANEMAQIANLTKELAETKRKYNKIMSVYSTIYKVLDLQGTADDQGSLMLKIAGLIPQIQNNPNLNLSDPEIPTLIAEYEATNH